MPSRINHLAIVSDQYTLSGMFYETVFGLRPPRESRLFNAITLGDGYVGLNINPRPPGRPPGLDHFGIEVDDAEATRARMSERYPHTGVLKRPANRAFAGYTTHDPDGNIVDIHQRNMANRGEIYAENDWEQDTTFTHYAVRTMDPEAVARFYVDVFDLDTANTPGGERSIHLTDGRMTLVLSRWRIDDFAGTGIVRPGPDHVCFRVPDVDALKSHLEAVMDENPHLAPRSLGIGRENRVRREIFAEASGAELCLADVDGVLVGVSAH